MSQNIMARIVDYICPASTFLVLTHVFDRKVIQATENYSDPNRTSVMELFAKIVNDF